MWKVIRTQDMRISWNPHGSHTREPAQQSSLADGFSCRFCCAQVQHNTCIRTMGGESISKPILESYKACGFSPWFRFWNVQPVYDVVYGRDFCHDSQVTRKLAPGVKFGPRVRLSPGLESIIMQYSIHWTRSITETLTGPQIRPSWFMRRYITSRNGAQKESKCETQQLMSVPAKLATTVWQFRC